MNAVECTQVLPSAQSSLDVLQGKPGSWIDVGRDILQRSALIAGGLWLAGDKDVVKKSLIASTVIEAFVLLEAGAHLEKQKAKARPMLPRVQRRIRQITQYPHYQQRWLTGQAAYYHPGQPQTYSQYRYGQGNLYVASQPYGWMY
jgi:hypothetical protein